MDWNNGQHGLDKAHGGAMAEPFGQDDYAYASGMMTVYFFSTVSHKVVT